MFRKETGDKFEVDINRVIRTVMGLVSADLQKHNIELNLELTDRLPSILSSHVELQQVILNLVMNVIDAMRSVHPRVLSVKSKLNEFHGVHVSIEDTGIGIGPADFDRIFEPLFTTKNMAWGWVFPSAIRSLSITAVGFGHRRVSLEVQSFNWNCRRGIEPARAQPRATKLIGGQVSRYLT